MGVLVPDYWSRSQDLPYLDVNIDGVSSKNAPDPTAPLSPEQRDRVDSDIVAAEARACGLFYGAMLGSIFMPDYCFVGCYTVRIYFSKNFSFGGKELGFFPQSWEVYRCSQWSRVQLKGVPTRVSKDIYSFLLPQSGRMFGSPVTENDVGYALKRENGLKLARTSATYVPRERGKSKTDKFTVWVGSVPANSTSSVTESPSCSALEWRSSGKSYHF